MVYALFRTFNLPNKKMLTGRCLGNDISLGLTDVEKNYGTTYFATNIWNSPHWSIEAYGNTVGDTQPHTTFTIPANNKVLGISRDASKSGIICESDNNMYYIIKNFKVFCNNFLSKTINLNIFK